MSCARTARGVAHIPLWPITSRSLPAFAPAGIRRARSACPSAPIRRQTVVVYRPALQWPMYGVDSRHTVPRARFTCATVPAKSGSEDAGSLIEFPAVVSEGMAYIGNLHGTVTCDRNGRRPRCVARAPI